MLVFGGHVLPHDEEDGRADQAEIHVNAGVYIVDNSLTPLTQIVKIHLYFQRTQKLIVYITKRSFSKAC